MSDHPELWLNSNLGSFAHITPEAVEHALDGFPLESCKSSRWMAGHLRGVHFSAVGDGVDEYPGEAQIREELKSISTALENAIQRFEQRSGWAESVLRTYGSIPKAESPPLQLDDFFDDDKDYVPEVALKDEEKRDQLYLREITTNGSWAEDSIILARHLPAWREFRENVKGLYAMKAFFDSATIQLLSKNEPRQWRNQIRRKSRIEFAAGMSAIYEIAYKKTATTNGWQDDFGHSKLGLWPDFFDRIARMSLKLDRIPDIEAVLKMARRNYKDRRMEIFDCNFPGENPP